MAALVLADMCLMQEARKASAVRLPQEISAFFCDPSMDGTISYNGKPAVASGVDKETKKKLLEAKKASLEAQLQELSLQMEDSN
eukprot:CAMPEP_0184306068 /NCGR_PEP_ID=MMETSP1049-20130417/15165_1 /TAXON_ID=77928 /ORGANISM="Proteomonas sulcata, Strain CCMP704" /LENGTH=83 /DNA_ID=CAMNT_0026618251 /DNA_START=17 /DNA_END=268 /DNA_ORIENTATION=+